MKSRVNVITSLFILAALLTIVESTFASSYYVSIDGSNETGDGSSMKPWRTIQFAVNQIYESDATVYVGAGTYEEQVVVQEIATGIDLIGDGADVTIIDASGRYKNGGAIKLPPGEGFTISGFTITGGTYEGSGSPGGAIRGVSATGFNVSTTSALVENNIIVDNRSWGYDYAGGAITLGPNCIIRNNEFIDNSIEYGCGAVYVGENSLIEDNVFRGNIVYSGGGGALEAHHVSVIVRRNIFEQNRCGWGSSGYGGAFRGKATVYNNLFVANSSRSYNDGYGGAAYLTGGYFINNTLVGNIGDNEGDCSGVYCAGNVVVANNIIVNGIDGTGIYVKSGATVTANYNNIWNNDFGAYGGLAVPGSHDIHQDPLFVDANNYRLKVNSPCIDAGDNTVVPADAIPLDLDSKARFVDSPTIVDTGNGTSPIVDLGAYEVFSFPSTAYEVWGGETFIGFDQSGQIITGAFVNIDQLEANGYIKLGESGGETAIFIGEHKYYLIATKEQFLLDSIQGSDGSYYSSFESNFELFGVMQPDSLLNPPDGIYATIGVTDPIGDFSGYFAFTNPGNWTGLTVFTTEVILNLKKGILGIPEGQIAKVDSNDIITYTIDLDNKENDFPVTDVLVVDYLPAEVTFINATVGNASGFYDPKTHTYNWSYPSLQVGAAEHLELVVSVNSNLPLGTIITNIVTIDSDEIPPFTTSIDAVVPYKPLNIVKKAVDMSGSEIVWINPGERFTYQICFDNNNESMVTDVLIVDQLPDEVTFVMADDGKATGKYDEKAHTYTCTYGSLEPGLTECLELVVDVKPEVDMDTIITNSVTIDSNETLPTTADIDVVIGESLLEFISLEIHMEHIWDYNDPADDSDLTFEFRLRIEVIGIDSVYEEIVDSVEFLTPAGNTFRIPKQPGQWSDGIWTSYEYDPEWDWATWQYRAILTKLDDLQEYGDGEYTITPIYTDGTRDSETFWFGIPDTNDPIPQPTQEPVITFPLHKQIAESPVTFTWEPCKDTNASEVGIEMQEQETGAFKEEYFDVSETEWGPVILTDGLWQADLVFGHWETLEFNNILFNFSKSSRSRYVFTVFGYPRTTYEVWGGDTWIYWDEGSYRKIADLEEYGYKKLGESDGKTATFTGEYEYYLIATRGRFLLDSIQGSDGSYYSSFEANCSRGNISSEDYLLGPPDEQYAIVGSGNPWYQDDFSGYMTFTNPGNWTGLTVLVGEITPSEVENLSITPNVLRRNGTSQYITAIVQFPEGIKQSDIDPDDRAELYYQDRSTKEFVLIGEGSRPDIYGTEDRPKINISFDRSELMDALYGYGEFKLRVKGKLKSGQTYYGDDMINVTRFAGD